MTEVEQLIEGAIHALEHIPGIDVQEKVEICDRIQDQIYKARSLFMAQWERELAKQDEDAA